MTKQRLVRPNVFSVCGIVGSLVSFAKKTMCLTQGWLPLDRHRNLGSNDLTVLPGDIFNGLLALKTL